MELNKNPFVAFDDWHAEAKADDSSEYSDKFCLSTIGEDGYPEGRVLLLKGKSEKGYAFYTNLNSAKCRSLKANARVAMTFHWVGIQKQVRIQGDVCSVTDAEADAYFASRSRESQIGAWASDQSAELDSRESLEQRVQDIRLRFEGKDISRPANWSGYWVLPKSFEFWINREARLHDRFLYTRSEHGTWEQRRLYP